MARSRKRHVQQELFGPRGGVVRSRKGAAPQSATSNRAVSADNRGTKRRGPGRPPITPGRRRPAHQERPELLARHPVHIVLRVVDEIGNLRKRSMYQALRAATLTAARRSLEGEKPGEFRIVHVSIQQKHVHLLVEAAHKTALSRGLQSFEISAAKHLNRAATPKGARRRRGKVFPDRFHEEIITTPRQARHALAYVLNNWRRHREDRSLSTMEWNVDPFSTGALFTGWAERTGKPLMWQLPVGYQPLVVQLPRTWLLRVGWERGGGQISYRHVPGAPPRQSSQR